MDLTKVISITGKPGLFELLSQTRGGFIVKDLDAQKKSSINANSQVSLIQNISIYTQDSEVSLISVFISIAQKHNFQELKFEKNNSEALHSLMKEVQPDYAQDRVYNSDLKKLFSWYNILIKNKILTEEGVKTYLANMAQVEAENNQEVSENNQAPLDIEVTERKASKKAEKKESKPKTKSEEKSKTSKKKIDQ
ncbi:DUF5606 family protein [Apibacter muscae]|uniref:DUF5606 family protein n=1 Tax=Apibacter muscae TaxID=2509004 RepID=UPI00162603D9|nr:DUF5606 domain-containing protein [Apibacter muscae]